LKAGKKSYWKREIPETEGWYWIRYRGKNGIVVCPCIVIRFGEIIFIKTARNDSFTVKPKKDSAFAAAKFGSRLREPKP
jgi:hypothetical protein